MSHCDLCYTDMGLNRERYCGNCEAAIDRARAEGAAQEREAMLAEMRLYFWDALGWREPEKVPGKLFDLYRSWRARGEPSGSAPAAPCPHGYDTPELKAACVGCNKPDASAPAAPRFDPEVRDVDGDFVRYEAPKPDARAKALAALERIKAKVPAWRLTDYATDLRELRAALESEPPKEEP